MFTQVLDPTGNLFATWLVAMIPVVLLLVMLAVFRVSAWLATLIGSLVTFLLAWWALGQDVADLPRYLASSREIAAGYAEAMAADAGALPAHRFASTDG